MSLTWIWHADRSSLVEQLHWNNCLQFTGSGLAASCHNKWKVHPKFFVIIHPRNFPCPCWYTPNSPIYLCWSFSWCNISHPECGVNIAHSKLTSAALHTRSQLNCTGRLWSYNKGESSSWTLQDNCFAWWGVLCIFMAMCWLFLETNNDHILELLGWFGKCWHGVAPAASCADANIRSWLEVLNCHTTTDKNIKEKVHGSNIIFLKPFFNLQYVDTSIKFTKLHYSLSDGFLKWISLFFGDLHLIVKQPLKHHSLHNLSVSCCDVALFVCFFGSEAQPHKMSPLVFCQMSDSNSENNRS